MLINLNNTILKSKENQNKNRKSQLLKIKKIPVKFIACL